MNIQHLNELIRVLENIKPVDFNLIDWVIKSEDFPYNTKWSEEKIQNLDPENLHIHQQLTDEHNCGAVCCALGWAAQDPYFNNLNFHLDKFNYPVLLVENPDGTTEELLSFEGAVKILGFNTNQTCALLFLDEAYPTGYKTTPEQVIARVRDLVKIGESEFIKKYESIVYKD